MTEPEIIRLDWHAAYFEAIQAELIDYLPYLHFLPEHPLNEKPLRIDAMIIKAKPGVEIKKNFAEEFRGHNIIMEGMNMKRITVNPSNVGANYG